MARRAKQCKHCGKPATARRRISWSGSCAKCAAERYTVNTMAMVNRDGEAYERWRAGMARAAGVELE